MKPESKKQFCIVLSFWLSTFVALSIKQPNKSINFNQWECRFNVAISVVVYNNYFSLFYFFFPLSKSYKTYIPFRFIVFFLLFFFFSFSRSWFQYKDWIELGEKKKSLNTRCITALNFVSNLTTKSCLDASVWN